MNFYHANRTTGLIQFKEAEGKIARKFTRQPNLSGLTDLTGLKLGRDSNQLSYLLRVILINNKLLKKSSRLLSLNIPLNPDRLPPGSPSPKRGNQLPRPMLRSVRIERLGVVLYHPAGRIIGVTNIILVR